MIYFLNIYATLICNVQEIS